MKKLKFLIIIIFFCAFSSCYRFPGIPAKSTPDSDTGFFVINSLAQTLSFINLENGNAFKYLAYLDRAPNNLVKHNDRFFLVNSLSNSIDVFRAENFQQIYTIDTGINSNPWSLEISEKHNFLVLTCFLSSELLVFDLVNFSLIKKIKLNNPFSDFSAGPEGLAIVGDKAYIACTNFNRQAMSFGQAFAVVVDLVSFEQEVILLNQLNQDNQLDDQANRDAPNSEILNCQNLIYFEDLAEIHFICTGINSNDDGYIVVYDIQKEKIVQHLRLGGSPFGSKKNVDFAKGLVYLLSEKGIIIYQAKESGAEIVQDFSQAYYPVEISLHDYVSDIFYDGERDKLYLANFSQGEVLELGLENFEVERKWRLESGIVSIYKY